MGSSVRRRRREDQGGSCLGRCDLERRQSRVVRRQVTDRDLCFVKGVTRKTEVAAAWGCAAQRGGRAGVTRRQAMKPEQS